MTGPLAGAGSPRRREGDLPLARRVGSFVVWWILLMSFWVWLDDTIGLAELLVGAGAAALGAALVELVQYQSATHIRIRIEWVTPALRLPGQIARDLAIVYGALWRQLVRHELPNSGFVTKAVRLEEESPEEMTRRVLIIGGHSVSPNSFALGIDEEREALILHHLVVPGADPTRPKALALRRLARSLSRGARP